MITPPFAVPSSLVSTKPVTPSASWNRRACWVAVCPVVASTPRRTSWGAPPRALAGVRLSRLSSSITVALVCRPPAAWPRTPSIFSRLGRQLADGGGFPGPLHAHPNHDHGWRGFRQAAVGPGGLREDALDLHAQRGLHLPDVLQLAPLELVAHRLQQPGGGVHADVGGEQDLLQLGERRFASARACSSSRARAWACSRAAASARCCAFSRASSVLRCS